MEISFFHNTIDNLIEVDIFTIEDGVHVDDFAGSFSAGAPAADEAGIVRAGEYGDCGNGQGGGYVLAGGIVTDEVAAVGDEGCDLAAAAFEGEQAV